MRKAKYAIFILAAALCGLLYSYTIDNEYVAQVKVVDEYKVTDLAVGMNKVKALMRDLTYSFGNTGTDDAEIYNKILKSEDFIRQAAAAKVEKYGTDYEHYLGDIETVRENIKYNFNTQALTLDIQVADHDPDVAMAMLDTVVANLRQHIEMHSHRRAAAMRDNAKARLDDANRQYQEAMKAYSSYANAHQDLTSEVHKKMLESLRQNYLKLGQIYRNASEEYTRAEYLTEKSNISFTTVKNSIRPLQPLTPRHWVYFAVFALIAALLCTWHHLWRNRAWNNLERGRPRPSHNLIANLDFGGLFSPWTLTVGIWVGILSLYYILQTELYPITAQFYNALAIWLVIFCITSFVTYNLARHGSSDYSKGISLNRAVFNAFFLISMVITPLYIYRVWQIVNMFSTEDLMNSVRLLALYGEGFGLLNYSNVINQSLFIVALWAHPKVPLWQVVWLAVACLLNALAIMEKGTMFFVFICTVFVLFERRVIRVRTIAVLAAIVLVLFYIFNLARAEQDSDYQTNETLLGFVAMYALSPPVAFCQLTADITPQFGTNTFEIIYLFLDRLGVSDIVVKQKLQEFVYVPIITNVYTIFQPFFIDFGYKGIAFFAAFYGTLSGWLYRLYRNGDSIGCCLYTYMAELLILQFYQENLMLSLVFNLQILFFVTIFAQNKISLNFNPTPHAVSTTGN